MTHPVFTIKDEPFAVGYIECPSDNLCKKIGAGYLRVAQEMQLREITPSWVVAAVAIEDWRAIRRESAILHTGRINVKMDLLREKIDAADDPDVKAQYEYIAKVFDGKDTRAMCWAEHSKREDSLWYNNVLWGGAKDGHRNLDYGGLVRLGTNGYRAKIAKYRPEHPESAEWYDGVEYALDALDTLGDRMRALALEKAKLGDEHQALYERMAEALTLVPREPAKDFYTAVQSMCLLFTFDGPDAPGPFDQYMYDYYKLGDHDDNWKTLEGFWELMHDFGGVLNLCVGGSDKDYNDLSNLLSYDILEMNRQKVYKTPNLTLRWCRNTPDEFLRAAARCLAMGHGTPALYNDECVCPALEKQGILPEDAHLYAMNGCNQIEIQGKSHMGLEDGEVSMLKCLEFALFDGVDQITGEQLGVNTGDATKFATYDDLWTAFKKQVDYTIDVTVHLANRSQEIVAQQSPHPIASFAVQGCIEKGKDFFAGGPIYNHAQVLTEGLADAADSLTAIRHFVYETGEITMETLLDALKKDYEGYEPLRKKLENYVKFGNDNDEADQTCTDIQKYFFNQLATRRTWRDPLNGQYGGGLSTFQRTARFGRTAGASANGRHKSGELIADSIGATPGFDKNGPTAALCSALKYDHSLATSGFVMQLKFDKTMFRKPENMEKFILLVKGYFMGGGQQLTINVVDAEELKDAKIHPERHQNLIVRVGGYSAYFTGLEEGLQDNIIARTTQAL